MQWNSLIFVYNVDSLPWLYYVGECHLKRDLMRGTCRSERTELWLRPERTCGRLCPRYRGPAKLVPRPGRGAKKLFSKNEALTRTHSRRTDSEDVLKQRLPETVVRVSQKLFFWCSCSPFAGERILAEKGHGSKPLHETKFQRCLSGKSVFLNSKFQNSRISCSVNWVRRSFSKVVRVTKRGCASETSVKWQIFCSCSWRAIDTC